MENALSKIYRLTRTRTPKPYMQTLEVELDGDERVNPLDADGKLSGGPGHFPSAAPAARASAVPDAMNISGKNSLAY